MSCRFRQRSNARALPWTSGLVTLQQLLGALGSRLPGHLVIYPEDLPVVRGQTAVVLGQPAPPGGDSTPYHEGKPPIVPFISSIAGTGLTSRVLGR
jgi:hypothetical protein